MTRTAPTVQEYTLAPTRGKTGSLVRAHSVLLFSSIGCLGTVCLFDHYSRLIEVAFVVLSIFSIAIFLLPTDVQMGASYSVAVILSIGVPADSYFGSIATYGVPSASILVLLLGICRRGSCLSISLTFLISTAMFVTISAVSVFWPTGSPYYFIPLALLPIGLVYGGNLYRRDWIFLRLAIVVTGCLEVVAAFLDVAVLNRPLLSRGRAVPELNPFIGGYDRAQGSLAHPLVLGTVLLVVIAVVATTAHFTFYLKIGLQCWLAFGIVLSGSSSPLLVAGVILVASLVVGRGAFLQTIIYTAVALLMLVGAVFFLPQIEGGLAQLNSNHRALTLARVPNLLFDRSLIRSIAGDGLDSAKRLYESGFLNNDYFYAVDNQWVRSLIEGGLLSVVLLVAMLLICYCRGTTVARVGVLLFVTMSFSFDLLAWVPIVLLLAVLLAQSSLPRLAFYEAGGLREAGLAQSESGGVS